jgi:hypothetical protein
MMEKDTKNRIQTMAEVAARLEVWATSSMPLAPSTLTRSSWLAPPPPVVDLNAAANVSDEANQETSMPSMETSQSRAGGNLSVGASESADRHSREMVSPPQFIGQSGQQENAMSPAMLVAMTIAIVLPPALLIGAILGYLISYQR